MMLRTRRLSKSLTSSLLFCGLVCGFLWGFPGGLFCASTGRAESAPPAAKPAPAPTGKPLLKPVGKAALKGPEKPVLNFMRFGKGPAVVFLHGLGADSSVFIDEMQKLEATHTVLLIDLPGHGQSKAPPPHIELPVIAKQITDLIAAQKVGPAIVVGHSLGGTLAGYVGLADKSVVRGLVIIDSMFAPYPIPQEELERMRFKLGRDPARALRDFFGPMAKDARQLDKLVASAWRVSPQTLVGYLDFASERDDLRRRASEISAPVHVMATPMLVDNQTDPARVRVALGQVGYSGVTNLSYDLFPKAKHWLFWDEPEAFHASLDKFLRRVEGALPVAVTPPKGPTGAALEKKKGRPLARAPQ